MNDTGLWSDTMECVVDVEIGSYGQLNYYMFSQEDHSSGFFYKLLSIHIININTNKSVNNCL